MFSQSQNPLHPIIAIGQTGEAFIAQAKGVCCRRSKLSVWRPRGVLTLLAVAMAVSVIAQNAGASDPAAYVRSDSVNAVVYRAIDSHIHEISLALGGTAWHTGDLCAGWRSCSGRESVWLSPFG